jgi:hypothetical protein
MAAPFVPPDVANTIDAGFISQQDVKYVLMLREAFDSLVPTTQTTLSALFGSPDYKPSPQNLADYFAGYRDGFQKLLDLTKALMVHNNVVYAKEDPQPVFPRDALKQKINAAIVELKKQPPLAFQPKTFGGKQKKSTTSKTKKSTKSRSRSRGRSRTRK